MAVATPSGLFELVKMPLGLSNAVQTFQILMHEARGDLENLCTHLDHNLFARHWEERYSAHIFDRLSRYGVTINAVKYELEQLR